MFGISKDEFLFLTEPAQRELIKANLGADPSVLALKGFNTTLCRQIKALEKCKEKLPHFYNALCVIPPTSIEQASSIYTTNIKEYSGNAILDLTCGLGGDTTHFAKHFKQVTSIERDPLLAKIAEYNFNNLNISNIEVKNQDASAFLKEHNGTRFDIIYCDPARRDETRRTFLLEECSPDIISLLDDIKRHTDLFVVKLSPLFDIDEIFKIFSNYGVTVEVVSYNGECKEVIAEIAFGERYQKITNTIIDKDGSFKKYNFKYKEDAILKSPPSQKRYIYIADVSFKKCRNTKQLICSYDNINATVEENVVFTDNQIDSFPGRGYKIVEVFDYKPKALKKIFKERAINGATIIKGNTTKALSEIRKALSLKDNNDATIVADRDSIYLVETINALP